MEINLNALQRSIKQLEKESSSYQSFGLTEDKWSLTSTLFNLRNKVNTWGDLDAVTRKFECAYYLWDDISHLQKALLEANHASGLHAVLMNLEKCDKQRAMLNGLKSTNMLTRAEVNSVMLEYPWNEYDFKMTVTDYSTERFAKMTEALNKDVADLLDRRDILNAQWKVDVSELTDYSKMLLGLG
jgi:hypothetical protein